MVSVTNLLFYFVTFTEFELVQNAFFTDPSDQSAWFYHKWLLGKGQSIRTSATIKTLDFVIVAFNSSIRICIAYVSVVASSHNGIKVCVIN